MLKKRKESQKIGIVQITKSHAGSEYEDFPKGQISICSKKLIEPCILAGSKTCDIVLDPFFGSGTTGTVTKRLGMEYIGIELNEKYCEKAIERLGKT